jgi:hypothetical protein
MKVRRSMYHALKIVAISALLLSIHPSPTHGEDMTTLNDIAERYVKLALRVGLYNDDYVDAYFGPPEWKPAPLPDTLKTFPSSELTTEVAGLLDEMAVVSKKTLSPSLRARWNFLEGQIKSLATVIDLTGGRRMTFDDEAKALYGVVPPSHDSLYYDSVLQKLDKLLPGDGTTAARMNELRDRFVVPADKVDTLIKVAIAECRTITKKHIKLPDGEEITSEIVSKQPWSAYNWYKGNNVSLIQIDTTDKVRIPDIINFAAHEAYPGHHVQNSLQESRLYRDSGWVEYCVQPLFAPTNLIMEGAADFGIDLVFPKEEWFSYAKNTLCPLAGTDTAGLELYYDVIEARSALGFASIDAARQYLDGRRSRDETVQWLMRYGLSTEDEAVNSLAFWDKYRSYIITYQVGKDLVRDYVEAHGGTESNLDRRWELLEKVISSPTTVSDLVDSASSAR